MINLKISALQVAWLTTALDEAISSNHDYIDAHTPVGIDYPNLADGRRRGKLHIQKYKALKAIIKKACLQSSAELMKIKEFGK